MHQLTNPQMAQVASLKFSPNGRFLASGHVYSIIFIWDPETGKLIKDFGKSSRTLGVRDLSISSDSSLMAISRRNGDIEIRATQTD
ncbi:MAG: hypothetical protein P8M30_09470 [Planctomycetaceae bacterium]|nr:hypothetical protein [Planctomycetaceae bacterium]